MRRTAENNTTTPQPLSNDSGGHFDSAGAPTPTVPRDGNMNTGQKNQAPSSSSSSPKADQSKQTTSSTKDPASNSAGSSHDNTTVPITTNTRSRRDRPCDACRRRKSRCALNEGSTVCVLCQFHNQECTFVQSPQPRRRKVPADGVAADNKKDRDRERSSRQKGKDGYGVGQKDRDRGSYSKKSVHRLTFIDASLPSNLRSRSSLSEPSSCPRTSSRKRATTPPQPPLHASGGSRVQRASALDDYLPNDCEQQDQQPSLELPGKRHAIYLGETAEYDRIIIDLGAVDSESTEIPFIHHRRNTVFRILTKRDTFIVFDDMLPDQDTGQNNVEFDQELQDVDAVEAIVAPHGSALIDLYFRVVHPSFPILHKKLFVEMYKRSHREFAPCLLSAVYLIALNWLKYDPELSKIPPPDIDKLEKLANRCMSDVIAYPKLSTIQAGLLMLQRLGPAATSKSWALTAQLVAVGQELGLHLDCMEWRIPNWQKGLRKRLAWALYMQDKWGALTHGRPSHITSVNWAVRQIALEDFPEIPRDDENEDEVVQLENGKLLFMEMIKLTQITGDILDGFFTVEASRTLSGKINRVLERAKPMQIKLKEWYSRLPDVLRMDSASRVKRLSSNGYLHLAYFATEITLHRQILRTLSPPLTSPHSVAIPDPYLLHICRSAAKTRLISAMDFVNRLKPEHLQSFWYFASKVNFALIGTFGSLLWATSPNVQEAEFYKARLAEYRWTLGVSAKGADFMEFAVSVLDAGIGRVQQDQWKERYLKNHPDQAGAANSDTGDSSLGMLGLGMGAGLSSGGSGLSGTSGISTGTGISSPTAIPPPYVPPPLPHMSPPVTGDEMDQDDDDEDDDDDDDGQSFGNAAGFRIGHGSDHDMDMEFMGESRFARYDIQGGGVDPEDEGESDESGSSYPHPSQPLSSGYSPQHHHYQQHFQQYDQSHGWQDPGRGVGAQSSSA